MVPLSHLIAFAAVATILVTVPGPSVVFTISRALSRGRQVALLNVVGNSIGLIGQVVVVALGLGALVERSVEVFTVVKLIGAIYLVYLGLQAIRHRRSFAESFSLSSGNVHPVKALRDGMVVGATNPKSIAFFVVVLPQFTLPSLGDLPLQLLTLGLVFAAIALVLDSLWAIGAASAGQWVTRSPRRLSAIGGASGLVMIGLGVSVVATGRKN